MNWLANNQTALHNSIMKYFTVQESSLMISLIRELGEPELGEVESVLEVVESDQISEEEITLMVEQMQQSLEFLNERNIELSNVSEPIAEMILNQPAVDTRHVLKVSIPIIPFILAYEGELGLGAGVKLRETWNYWKAKLLRK